MIIRKVNCKRELKFADLIGKSIVPIAYSVWIWGDGLLKDVSGTANRKL
jgi:hypothetical protein